LISFMHHPDEEPGLLRYKYEGRLVTFQMYYKRVCQAFAPPRAMLIIMVSFPDRGLYYQIDNKILGDKHLTDPLVVQD